MSNHQYELNESHKLPEGIKDFAESYSIFFDIISQSPEALIGGFWKFYAEPEEENFETDIWAMFKGVGFLSGIVFQPPPLKTTFYFFIYPFKNETEVLTVNNIDRIWSLTKVELNIPPEEELLFKLKILPLAYYCSPELLPKLFENLRNLQNQVIIKTDWVKIKKLLPQKYSFNSKMKQVEDFVGEMIEENQNIL